MRFGKRGSCDLLNTGVMSKSGKRRFLFTNTKGRVHSGVGNWKSRGRIVGNRCNFVESWKGERPGCYRTQQQKGEIVFSHYAPDFPKGKASSGWMRLKAKGTRVAESRNSTWGFQQSSLWGSDQKMKGGGERKWFSSAENLDENEKHFAFRLDWIFFRNQY